MPGILIVSKDKDFSAPLAEQVRRELNLDCREAAAAGDVKDVDLIVTDGETGGWDVPTLALSGRRPLRMNALLAEIEGMLRRAAGETMRFGEYEFAPRQRRLTHLPSGKAADLTDKEAGLLMALREAGEGGVAKDALLKNIWGIGEALNTHTLETHIYRLRAKCKELSGSEMIMASGGGYRLET